jgi:hypothetical protein
MPKLPDDVEIIEEDSGNSIQVNISDSDTKLSLAHIREDFNYVNILNVIIKDNIREHGSISIRNLIDIIHDKCPELKQFCEDNSSKFRISSVRDKGLVGKIVEYFLFGNLPNNNSCSDTPYGDIKCTHFKNIKTNNKAFNAKERLTLTNFGDPSKEENITYISDKNSLNETRFYEKIKTGIILVLQHENVVYETIDSVYNKKIIGIVLYNLDNIFEENTDVADIFQEDFQKIKKCIMEKNVTQSGQQYLHIHKHGCKDGTTRAFGFTNKFLTKLVSIKMNIPLTIKGKSEYIEF